jgi:hypothetical protein
VRKDVTKKEGTLCEVTEEKTGTDEEFSLIDDKHKGENMRGRNHATAILQFKSVN